MSRTSDLTAQPAYDLQAALRRLRAAERAILDPGFPPLTSDRVKMAAIEYARAQAVVDQALKILGAMPAASV